jgi:hypothetical protein
VKEIYAKEKNEKEKMKKKKKKERKGGREENAPNQAVCKVNTRSLI